MTLQLCSIIGDVARSKSGMESSGQQIGVRGSHLPAKGEVWGEKNIGKSTDDDFGINVRPRQTSCVTDPPYPVNSPASQQRPPAKAGRTSTQSPLGNAREYDNLPARTLNSI